MAWTYSQSTGRLTCPHGLLAGTGYAGRGIGKNNPQAQDQHNVGPLPQGTYRILAAIADGGPLGPYVLPLSPNAANAMFGRSGFYMHGDSVHDPGNASDGCVVMDRDVREIVGNSLTSDNTLKVVA